MVSIMNVSLKKRNKNIVVFEKPYCKCGCGELIIPNQWTGKYADYIKGHSERGKKKTKEQIQFLSELRKGTNNPNYGNKGVKNPWFGRKMTEEARKKISLATKGKNNPRYGVSITEESRMKMSMSQKGIRLTEETKQKLSLIFSMERNPNWKGGTSFEPYTKEFNNNTKTRIKERDNNECQNPNCNHKSIKLLIHHIDYDKQNCKDTNLITVCNSCNSKANFNRDYWINYFKEKLK